MSAIDMVLRQPVVQAIGWALLHFLWQGALVALVTATALALLRRSAADVRYVVSAIALSVMLTLPAVTAVQTWRSVSPEMPSGSASLQARRTNGDTAGLKAGDTSAAQSTRRDDDRAGLKIGAAAVRQARQTVRLDAWVPLIVLVWLCGVIVLSLRLISGWLWVQRMKSHGTERARDGWQLIASRLARRLHIGRRVVLLESTLVDVPTVIGWIRPVVLLPVSALSGLTVHQLEAILAHELAHIRRHDYFVNLLQTLVETLLFYHPAVWWLSRRIRMERENCCDDLAVSLCGDPVAYAAALAELEARRGDAPEFAMAASGGSLLQRIRRLLGAPSHAGRAPGWLAGSASVIVMLGIVASVVRANVAAQPAPVILSAQSRALAAAAAQPVRAVRAFSALHEVRAYTRPFYMLLEFVHSVFPQVPPPPPQPPEPPTPPEPVTPAEPAPPPEPATPPEPPTPTEPVEPPTPREPSARLVLPEPPAPPELPVPSVPPEPPSPPARSVPAVAVGFGSGGQTHGTFTYQNNGQKLEIRHDGDVEFSDDDTDVKRMSPGGRLRIKDDGFLSSGSSGRTIEFSADPVGNITRRYWVGTSERPFEPEGRQWLAQVLPRFIRQTGIGAPARVARILKARGSAGVLAEISQIEGSWAKRVYFNELLKAPLDAAAARQALVQAGREIDSDFELASLLSQASDKLLVDDSTRAAYFEAARTIQSDFEMHRAYAAALKRGPVSPSLLASLLTASRDIDSDFEEAGLLIEVAKLQPLDNTTRGPFFDALATVASNFEHRRVLSAVAERSQLTPEVVSAMLTSAAAIDSDFELASFLLEVVKQQSLEGPLRAPFFRGVDSIDSAFERGRVLQAVAKRTDASPETVLAVLRATAGVKSSFEASNVLLALASTHQITGPARDAYIDVAEKLGDFEQGRTMSALVRNERRR